MRKTVAAGLLAEKSSWSRPFPVSWHLNAGCRSTSASGTPRRPDSRQGPSGRKHPRRKEERDSNGRERFQCLRKGQSVFESTRFQRITKQPVFEELPHLIGQVAKAISAKLDAATTKTLIELAAKLKDQPDFAGEYEAANGALAR